MRQSQQGTSYLLIMLLLFMAGLVLKLALAVIPAYLDDRIINGQIEELMQKEPNLSMTEFAQKANKRFEINAVRTLKFEDIAKTGFDDNGKIRVETDYEVRKPYLHNIELVIHFEKKFEQNTVKTE